MGLSRNIKGVLIVDNETMLIRKFEDNQSMSICEAVQKVEAALNTIKYGEIIIKVQNGKPIFVDKYERERVG